LVFGKPDTERVGRVAVHTMTFKQIHFVLGLSLLGPACSTQIPSSSRSSGGFGSTTGIPSGADPTPGTPNVPGGSTAPSTNPEGLPQSSALGPIALRRLNNVEYENTVQYLLKVASGTTGAFREDEPSLGYRNMAGVLTVTPLLAEQYATAAKKLATALDVNQFAPCANGTPESACAEAFIRSFGRNAFRRPVTAEEASGYGAIFALKAMRSDYAGGVRLVAETMLQSPYFLYKTEIGEGTGVDRTLTQYELAAQVSYLATGGPPDAELAVAADGVKLGTGAEREAQLRRLLGTPRSTAWLSTFVTQWLGIADAAKVAKDKTAYPDYTPTLSAAVADESLRFIGSVLTGSNGSLETLFTANWTLANPELGAHYGLAQAPADWAQVMLPADQRLGILTQSAFLVATSKAIDSFPIRRGKALRTHVLCGNVPPPPADLKVTQVALDPNLTTRERYLAHQQAGAACAGCHSLIEPLGFGFENYDATGHYRTTENGKPIDASGEIKAISPEVDGPFANAGEFVKRIAPSQILKDCVARESVRWALGRATATAPAMDPGVLRDQAIIQALSARLATNSSDVRELLVGLVQRSEFALRSDR